MAGRRYFTVFVCIAFLFSGCSRAPLNPPRLVISTDTDMAIQLFMQATILLANYYGYDEIKYAEVRARTRRAGLDSIPFMAPESVRATPALVNLMNRFEDDPTQLATVVQRIGGYKNLVKYYIRTGLRASQSICRTYLLNLDERSEYLDFLEKEVGVGYALSTGVLALVHANATLATSFLIARTGFDGGLAAYQDYRYLSIDREAARAVVEAAQNAYAQYFMQQVDATTIDSNLVTGGYTFSDALHAVSTIEYQCTRSGIKALLARSINNTPSNLMIDPASGTITFFSTVTSPGNPSQMGGVPKNGGAGSSGTQIPPGAGQQNSGQGQGGGQQRGSGQQGSGQQGSGQRGGQQGSGQGGGQQGAQIDPAIASACNGLPNKTTAQTSICNKIAKNPGLAGIAAAVLSDFISKNQSPMVIPTNTSLAALITGSTPPFEIARTAVVNDPRMKTN